MKRLRLTKKQRALQEEVSDLLAWHRITTDLTQLDPTLRTDYLTWAKRELTISAVLRQYLLMDEHLSNEMCWEFFPRRTYPELWQTKRFRDFNHHILDRLSLLRKLEFVRARIVHQGHEGRFGILLCPLSSSGETTESDSIISADEKLTTFLNLNDSRTPSWFQRSSRF